MDGNSFSIFDLQRRSKDTCVDVYASRWRALSRSCSGVLLNVSDLAIPFVSCATEFKYVLRTREMFLTNVSSEGYMVSLSQCCLSCPFSSFHLIRKVSALGRDVDLEVRQRLKDSLVS